MRRAIPSADDRRRRSGTEARPRAPRRAILTEPPLGGRTGRSRTGRATGRTPPTAYRPRSRRRLRRSGAAFRGHRRHAALGAHELACLLGHQPQHLLERVGGVEGERGIGQEGRQLTRHLGLAPFEPRCFAGPPRTPAGPSRTRTGSRGRSHRPPASRCWRLRRARRSGQQRQQGLLVGDGQVEHAQPPAHRLAPELVRDPERRLARVAQVVRESGRVRRPKRHGSGAHARGHGRTPR